MKKPKLKFQEVYVVEDWGTEIKKGVGVLFDKLKDYLVTHENYWLIWLENDEHPSKFYDSKVFLNYDQAYLKLQTEKNRYKKYLEEEIQKKYT